MPERSVAEMVPSLFSSEIDMRARRPAVDVFGSVMENVNRPNEPPWESHHDESALAVTMSDQSNATFPGQPSAVAAALGIAMTDGERARLGRRVGSIRATCALADAARAHTVEAGTHTSGGGPLSAAFQVLPSSVAMSAESRGSTVTDTHDPSTDGRVFAHAVFSCCTRG